MGIPVATTTAAQSAPRAEATQASETRLSGRWLIVARLVWFALAALMLTVFIAGLIASVIHVNTVCPTPACEKAPMDANLRQAAAGAGLTYASFISINIVFSLIFAIPYDVVAVVSFWRRSSAHATPTTCRLRVIYPARSGGPPAPDGGQGCSDRTRVA